jgi:hypothetical protein
MNFRSWLESLKNPYHIKRRGFEYLKANPDLLSKDIEEFPDDIWYHGTTSEFDQFKTSGIKRTTLDWNSRIGTHFTSAKNVAEEFASGLYKKIPASGRVMAARLHVNNPKHYEKEVLLANEAVAVAFEHGIITKSDFQKVLESKKTRELSSHQEYNDFLKMDKSFEEVFPKSRWNYSSFGFDVMYVATSTKKTQVAKVFRDYLKSQGHDSITYVNIVEGGVGSNLCVIIFDPSKIEVVGS